LLQQFILQLTDQFGDNSPLASEPQETMATGLMETERSHNLKTLEAVKWKMSSRQCIAFDYFIGMKILFFKPLLRG